MRETLQRVRPVSDDTGASAVEFALVVPVLLLIVFGLIDFGGLFAQQLALNNGVRQGTRAAVVSGTSNAQQCNQIVSGVQGASGPTIAMDTATIKVRTTVIDSLTGANTGKSCSGGFTATSGDTTKPCTGSYNPNTQTAASLKVEAEYAATFLIPMPIPLDAPTLRATAVYRCEFS